MKKISINLVVLLSLLLGGCGKAESNAIKESEERATIEIWSYYETDEQQAALDELVKDFNSSQDTYEANWEYVPMTEFTKKLSMGYTENALPDLVIMDNPDMPYYIKTGLLEDISDMEGELRIREDYYTSLLETVYDDGKLYGVPFNCNNTALFYRKDIFEENNIEVPRTWDELYVVANALTTENHYGFIMSAIQGEQGAFQILPWILSNGENIDSLGGEKTAETYEFLYSLIESGAMDTNCINYSQVDVGRKFASGEAVMAQNGPWIIPMLEKNNIEYGVTYLPAKQGRHAVVGGENLGVIRGKNIEGSKEFIRYCMQDDVIKKICEETGELPTKRTLNGTYSEEMEIFAEQMDGAMVRSSNKSWNGISEKIPDILCEMIADNIPAEDVVKELDPLSLK